MSPVLDFTADSAEPKVQETRYRSLRDYVHYTLSVDDGGGGGSDGGGGDGGGEGGGGAGGGDG